jgi:hypothetical protein
MRTCIAALALLVLAPQDKGARKLEWKLPPGHAAEFNTLDRAGKPIADQKLIVFGTELTPTSNRLAVDSYEQIPLALVFQLPPEAMKGSGLGWEFQTYFFNDAMDSAGGYDTLAGGSIRPVCAKGRYIAKVQKKGDEEIVLIEGSLSLVELRRDVVNNQMKAIITKNELGTLATSVVFSPAKGMIQKAVWQYKIRAQDREAGRIADKRAEVHGMIEFKEDVELDAAKIQPALDQAVTRAVEWLKKQQKAGAWSTGKPGPAGDATYLTSIVVRALAAAGVKPDDPAIAQASRTLRSPPPPETFVLCQQMLALAAKSPTAEEAGDLKRFADELVKRRDPRANAWAGVAGKNDTPSTFLSALALEALAVVPDAKGPDEPLRTGLDFFTGSWIEDDGKADLELELEKDATTIVPDPKKDKDLVPITWPAVAGRQNPNDPRGIRKGCFLTVAAGLRMLLLLPDRLKSDERVMKTVEGLLHRALANLQYRWTLRSVPPSESYWSTQRMEYLGMLGPTLALAKVNKIGGADWRLEGATLLLREQAEDGSWGGGADQAVARTAHALLFLASAKR